MLVFFYVKGLRIPNTEIENILSTKDTGWKGGVTAQCQGRVYCGEVVLWRGDFSKRVGGSIHYRLGVDKGGRWRSPRKVHRQNNP
jgi:hypothetical protein